MKVLVWLRNDLRLVDNPALRHAARAGEPVVVYGLCREHIRRHHTAPARLDLLRRQLHSLVDALAAKGIVLKLFAVEEAAAIPAALLAVADQVKAGQLFFNAEYPLDEQRRDIAVADAFRARGFGVQRYHDRVVLPPGTLRTAVGQPFKVFTAFKRAWLRQAMATSVSPLPEVPVVGRTIAGADRDAEAIDRIFESQELRDLQHLWPAGEAQAQRRLTDFVAARLDDYQVQRDFPDREGTSCLSPYLAMGVLSPRQCIAAALAANRGEWDSGSAGVTAWLNELIWRDFYQHLVVDFPQVCKHHPLQTYTERFPWRRDPELFAAWCQGRTGVPLVDAAMLQLRQCGWMHNRLRMVVAMFLTKNLQVDWRMGERWFMENLIDGDFAANNGGWQWSASTGTDAAPYFRIFNPTTQSQRFDPEGTFIRRYLPQLAHLSAREIHQPGASADYPAPIVDIARSRKETMELFGQIKAGGEKR